MKRKLDQMMADLMNLKPMLPGSITEQYNVCGKANCSCKDKVNPKKHGPQSRLSYSLPGKNSNIVIKKADVAIAKSMTDNFKNTRQLIAEISEEAIRLYREEGATNTQMQMQKAISHAKAIMAGRKPESARLLELQTSRDKWKTKAQERNKEIRKASVTIVNLTDSREKWRKEAMSSRREIERLKAHAEVAQVVAAQQAETVRRLEEDSKKKSQ